MVNGAVKVVQLPIEVILNQNRANNVSKGNSGTSRPPDVADSKSDVTEFFNKHLKQDFVLYRCKKDGNCAASVVSAVRLGKYILNELYNL